MTRKTITIPDELESWIQSRVADGQYDSESEYFRDLVRRDQESRRNTEKLRAMLDAAEAGGTSTKSLAEIRAEVRKELGL